MERARVDPYVMIRRTNGRLEGLVLLQVNDSLGRATIELLAEEKEALKVFRCKPRKIISTQPTTFNGLTVTKSSEDTFETTQTDKIRKLTSEGTQKELAPQRELAQYVGVNSRPDIGAKVQLIAPGNLLISEEEFQKLAKSTAFLHKAEKQALQLVPLDTTTERLVLLLDTSFENGEGLKSQLDYILIMTNASGSCNILHYGSNKCRRIARSVMKDQNQALVLGFEYDFCRQRLDRRDDRQETGT